MASVVAIDVLNHRSRAVKIRARILKVWNAQRAGQIPFGLNFVLLDDKGGAIQGLILAADYNRVAAAFVEGRICEFSRFAVRHVAANCRTVSHAYSLLFSKDTIVRPVHEDSIVIPLHYFDFKRMEDIGTDLLPADVVVDVVGRICGFGVVENVVSNGRHVSVQNMYVTNQRGYMTEISLWADFIERFDANALAERSRFAPVVVACSALQVRDFRGVWGLKTFVGSRFYVDLDLPEVVLFRESLPSGLVAMFVDGPRTAQGLRRSSLLVGEERAAKRVTIKELLAHGRGIDEAEVFECVAQIVDVNDWFGWAYPACLRCFRRAQVSDTSASCGNGSCAFRNRRIDPISWYRLPVEVSDGTGNAEFILIGRHAEIVVGRAAAAVEAEPRSVQDDAPPSLLEIVGKQFLFVVSVSRMMAYADHLNYTASRVVPVGDGERPLDLSAPGASSSSAINSEFSAVPLQGGGSQSSPSKVTDGDSSPVVGDVIELSGGDKGKGLVSDKVVQDGALRVSSGVSIMPSDVTSKSTSSASALDHRGLRLYAKRKPEVDLYCPEKSAEKKSASVLPSADGDDNDASAV